MRIKQHLKLIYLGLKQSKVLIISSLILTNIVWPLVVFLFLFYGKSAYIVIINLIYKTAMPVLSVLISMSFLNDTIANSTKEIVAFYKKSWVGSLVIIFCAMQINLSMWFFLYGLTHREVWIDLPYLISICLFHFGIATFVSVLFNVIFLGIGFTVGYTFLNMIGVKIPYFGYDTLDVVANIWSIDVIYKCIPFTLIGVIALILSQIIAKKRRFS